MAIGGSKIFVTGGSKDNDHSSPSLKDVLMYDAEDRPVIAVTFMNHQRKNHACTILQSHFHNKNLVLLVAGGDGDAKTTAEILDFQGSQHSKWTEGTY